MQGGTAIGGDREEAVGGRKDHPLWREGRLLLVAQADRQIRGGEAHRAGSGEELELGGRGLAEPVAEPLAVELIKARLSRNTKRLGNCLRIPASWFVLGWGRGLTKAALGQRTPTSFRRCMRCSRTMVTRSTLR